MADASVRVRAPVYRAIQKAAAEWSMSITDTIAAMARLWDQSSIDDHVRAIRSINETDASAADDQAENPLTEKETASAA